MVLCCGHPKLQSLTPHKAIKSVTTVYHPWRRRSSRELGQRSYPGGGGLKKNIYIKKYLYCGYQTLRYVRRDIYLGTTNFVLYKI